MSFRIFFQGKIYSLIRTSTSAKIIRKARHIPGKAADWRTQRFRI